MKRRTFISLLGGLAIVAPSSASAQTSPKVLRLGIAAASPRSSVQWTAFDQQMREFGYVEGQNIVVEFRNAGNELGRFPEIMKELLRQKVDVLMLDGEELALKAALSATSDVPIVMVAISFDPIARGYVSSLARPGANVTGVYFQRPEFVVKQAGLLLQG